MDVDESSQKPSPKDSSSSEEDDVNTGQITSEVKFFSNFHLYVYTIY